MHLGSLWPASFGAEINFARLEMPTLYLLWVLSVSAEPQQPETSRIEIRLAKSELTPQYS